MVQFRAGVLLQPKMSLQSLHNVLETDATAHSSAVFVYTTTPSAPFGAGLVKESDSDAEIWQMETRPGAGSALVGFVERIAFSSKGAGAGIEIETAETASVPAKRPSRSNSIAQKKAKITASVPTAQKAITVLSSPASFLSLVPSLLALPAANLRPSLAIHVSAQTSTLEKDGEGEVSLVQVPDLGSLFEGVKSLSAGGWTGTVVLSESAEDAAAIGTGVAKEITGAGYDIVSVFDGLTAGRQLSHLAATTPRAANGSLDAVLSAAVPYFSYAGPANATHVLVLPASTYSACANAAVAAITNGSSDVGVLTVRVVKPWNSAAFLAALPSSTTTLHLFVEASHSDDEQTTGPFYDEVLTTLLAPPVFKLKLRSLPIPATYVPTVQDWATRILGISSPDASMPAVLKSLLPEQAKLAVFWDLDSTNGQTELVAPNLARAFSEGSTGVEAKVETKFDNFKQGGLQQSLLLLEPAATVVKKFTISALAATALPSLLFLSSPAAVLKAYAPISTTTVGPETRIVLSANWTVEEVADKLPESAKNALAAISTGHGNLFVVDTDKLAADHKVQSADIAEVVFWSSYLPAALPIADAVTLLGSTPSFAKMSAQKLASIIAAVRSAITSVPIGANWSEQAVVDTTIDVKAPLASAILPTAAGPNADRTFVDPVARIAGDPKSSWFSVAQRLLFPEAFVLNSAVEEKMRPDLPEKNYLVTVTENRRLTPGNYDRNVFHLEMSTVGTGLKYTVGEALGIHGWNDEDEVREFIEWYGLDADAVVSFPAKDDPSGRVEHRTIFQIFQQTLDIFGKPGKAFYETLSKHATNIDQERALRFIACADGNATFKKMSEVDTLTYADLLRMFPSSKPSIEVLVHEIEEIKPRHYSIASSQNFVGDSVHLLVVTVEWEDPKGSSFLFAISESILILRSCCRSYSIRSMYSLPQQSQGWTASHGLRQAVGHEGDSLPCRFEFAVLTVALAASSS